MSNIFNDRRTTGISERTLNIQNLNITEPSLAILGIGDSVAKAPVGTAGLDLIANDTLDEIKDDLLTTRLQNLSTATISTESVATINGNVVNSTPVSTAGKNLMNITSIADLRTQILQTSEEAVVFTSDTNNEINFYTGSTQTASDLRLQLTNELIMLQTGDESMNIKLDNQSTWISFSEQLVFDNLEGPKLNFYKTGSIIEDNLYTLEVDTTTGGTKTLVYVSPEEHLFQVRDTSTQPLVGVLQDILLLEKDHVHITSDNGIMINGGFNIKNGNHGELATINGNKNLYYKTHGTGEHIFYVDDSTQILKVKSDGIECSKVIKAIGGLGNKILWDTTSRVYTSPGQIHYYTSDRQTFIWAKGVYVMLLTDVLISMTIPVDITGSCTATSFIGPLTGNADSATKIASINNSDIVQLSTTQTLVNKTLNNPTITGATIAGNILPNDDGTLNIGSSSLSFNNAYIDNIEVNVCNVSAGIIFQDIDNTKITLNANHTIGVLSSKTQYTAPTHEFLSGITPIFDIASDGMVAYKSILPTIDSSIDLGTSAKKYNYIYTDNIETETINSSSSITLKNGVNNLLSLNNTETTTYKNIVPNNTSILSLGSSEKRWDFVYTDDIFVLNSVSSDTVYASTLDAPSVITSTIDFPDTLADKILLYGTSYKLSVSDSSIDYITGDKHTFKASTNNLLILNNTSITTYKPIIPDTTGAIDIGSNTKLFNNGYINTLKTSSISPETTNGNLTLSGNGTGFVNITSTLTAPVGAILGKTLIGAVFAYGKFGVKSDGGALFIGNAAWDDNYSIFGHGIDVKNFVNNAYQYGLAVGIGTNSTAPEPYGVIKCLEPGFTWRRLHLSANDIYFDQTGTERMRIAGNIVCSTNIIPDSTINNRTIGSAGNLWNEIFCGNATINTSDRTKKKDIDYENIDKFADQLLNLKPCTYKFIQNTSNRNHMGLISQDIEGTIFEKTGAFIKSPKTKKISETIMVDGMKSSREKEVEIPNEYDYALRYGELIAPMIRLLQKQQEQIKQLVARVEILESGTGNELSFI